MIKLFLSFLFSPGLLCDAMSGLMGIYDMQTSKKGQWPLLWQLKRGNQNRHAIKQRSKFLRIHTACAVTAATALAAQPVMGAAAGLVRECVCGKEEAVCGVC